MQVPARRKARLVRVEQKNDECERHFRRRKNSLKKYVRAPVEPAASVAAGDDAAPARRRRPQRQWGRAPAPPRAAAGAAAVWVG